MTPTTARARDGARATEGGRDEEAVSESSSAVDARRRADARARTRAREGKGRARQEVLEEEEYAARLEAIIERDYFPDLRSNRLKAALLEATRRGDARAIAAVHREMNAERVRRVGSRGGVVGTPSIGGSGTTTRGAEASWETETPQRRNDFEDGDEEEEFVDYEECGIEGSAREVHGVRGGPSLEREWVFGQVHVGGQRFVYRNSPTKRGEAGVKEAAFGSRHGATVAASGFTRRSGVSSRAVIRVGACRRRRGCRKRSIRGQGGRRRRS